MFSVGQTVLYGTNGVCKIDDITNKKVGKISMEYYVLKPVCSGTSTLFVPTANETLVAKIRPILSEDEINTLLDENRGCDEWIENKLTRTEVFKEIISEGDTAKLIRLIRAIRLHEQEQISKGKRLHLSDERFLKEAEKMICEEFSLVLSIEYDEVISLIMNSEHAVA